jgi:DNA-binding response OmpR family regulator
VALTPLEFKLLGAFVRHPNQVLAHDQLLEQVWGGSFAASRDQVKLYVGYLRRKLEAAGAEASVVETVRGFGYRYRPPASLRGE